MGTVHVVVIRADLGRVVERVPHELARAQLVPVDVGADRILDVHQVVLGAGVPEPSPLAVRNVRHVQFVDRRTNLGRHGCQNRSLVRRDKVTAGRVRRVGAVNCVGRVAGGQPVTLRAAVAPDPAVREAEKTARGVGRAITHQEREVFPESHDADQIVADKGVHGGIGITHHVVADRDQSGQLLVGRNLLANARLTLGDCGQLRAIPGGGRRRLVGQRHGAARHRDIARAGGTNLRLRAQQFNNLGEVIRRDNEAASRTRADVQRLGNRVAFAIQVGRRAPGAIDVTSRIKGLAHADDAQRLVLLIRVVVHAGVNAALTGDPVLNRLGGRGG